MNSTAAILLGLLGASMPAHAQFRTYLGAGGAIPDVGTIVFQIAVPDHLPLVMENVQLDMVHTWSGDLRMSVVHGAQSVLLVDRLGVPQSGFGNSSDFAGVYEFRDGFAPLPETRQGEFIPPGVYGPDPSNAMADLNAGLDAFGTWSLVVEDFAAGDVGTLAVWSVTIRIPAPGSVLVLGAGSLFLARMRRREIAACRGTLHP